VGQTSAVTRGAVLWHGHAVLKVGRGGYADDRVLGLRPHHPLDPRREPARTAITAIDLHSSQVVGRLAVQIQGPGTEKCRTLVARANPPGRMYSPNVKQITMWSA
jgi:hypothetical protein